MHVKKDERETRESESKWRDREKVLGSWPKKKPI
jgi:hypothetical protein